MTWVGQSNCEFEKVCERFSGGVDHWTLPPSCLAYVAMWGGRFWSLERIMDVGEWGGVGGKTRGGRGGG